MIYFPISNGRLRSAWFLLNLLLLLLPAIAVGQGAEFHPRFSDDDPGGPTAPTPLPEEEGEEPKSKFPPSFTGFSRDFHVICSLIKADGRQESFSNTLAYLIDISGNCPGCRSFFRSFAGPCRPRAERQKKPAKKAVASAEEAGDESEEAVDTEQGSVEEEDLEPTPTPTPAPTPIPMRRAPSVELIDRVSSFLIVLSEDKRRAATAAQAIEMLVTDLRDPEGKTAGERDYYEILAEYFYAPFAEMLKKPEARKVRSADRPDSPPPPVDDLFSF